MKRYLIVLCLLCLFGCVKDNEIKPSNNQQYDSIQIIDLTITNEITDKDKQPVLQLEYVDRLEDDEEKQEESTQITNAFSLEMVEPFSNKPYMVINQNQPFFIGETLKQEAYEYFSPLDELGRCQMVEAMLDQSLMPTEKRGSIGMIKPSGWQLSKYDFVDGKYLFNRCHLIGYQLSGENDNHLNLITGTRYLNVDGMLPFENKVADYIQATNHKVFYRVTPIYEGNNLVASGVLMEAYSIEDEGKGICFNIYCYNVQPGVIINYQNGKNQLDESYEGFVEAIQSKEDIINGNYAYILNTSSKKIHLPTCEGASLIALHNMLGSNDSIEQLKNQGYSLCKTCLDHNDQKDTTKQDEQVSNYGDGYVLNHNTKKIHLPSCRSVPTIAKKNYGTSNESIATLESKGYSRCGNCLR